MLIDKHGKHDQVLRNKATNEEDGKHDQVLVSLENMI